MARSFDSKLVERLFEIEKVAISEHDSCEQAFSVVKSMIYELRREVEAGAFDADRLSPTAVIKWRPDMSASGNGDGRDRHYVMFHGQWRRVPRIVQRVWERVVPKLFGGCATSTIYADGRWCGELIDEAWRREHRG